MKKTALLSLVLISTFFISCTSVPEAPDPDYLGDFPQQDLGTEMLNTIPQGKNTLEPRDVSMIFYPQTNLVEMDFRYGMNNINIFLDQQTRDIMVTGMKKYIEQYTTGILDIKQDKKKAFFGKSSMRMMWGILAPSYTAFPSVRFEYQYITPEKPYFVLANASSPITTMEGSIIKNAGNSPAIRLAISPIQAEKMIETLSQDNLLAIVKELEIEAAQFDLPDADGAQSPDTPAAMF